MAVTSMFAHSLTRIGRTLLLIGVGTGGAFALPGCQGEIVTIGEQPAPTMHCVNPRLVLELAAYARTNNATLTADLLEIYFSSSRDENDFDIWTAERASRYDAFGAPVKVRQVSSSRFDTGSAVSADGLTLWLASDRRVGGGNGGGNNNTGLDIWVSTRASRTAEWGEPVLVPSLNSPQFDIPRPPGASELVMPLGTERGPGGIYRTYFASRASTASPFETPQMVPELMFENATTMDAFLSDDALTFFYSSRPVEEPSEAGAPVAADDGGTSVNAVDASTMQTPSADLYVAHRERLSDPFSGFAPIAELNTFFEERDPWMSPDKTQFYFTSDRGGNLNIYTCDVIFK